MDIKRELDTVKEAFDPASRRQALEAAEHLFEAAREVQNLQGQLEAAAEALGVN